MTNPDGTYECDRCGADCGNGGVRDCAIVADLDPDNEGHVRNLHFCRDREEDGRKIKGCARKLLSATNLKHREESRGRTEE